MATEIEGEPEYLPPPWVAMMQAMADKAETEQDEED